MSGRSANDPIADVEVAWEGQAMQSANNILAAAISGRSCRVDKREGDWLFSFGEGLHIAVAAPWRIVTSIGIAYGHEDDGHKFGLPEPVNGELLANEFLDERTVISVEVEPQTADLSVIFDSGARIDIFNNSSGYEGWVANVRTGERAITIVALGGGSLWIQ